MWPGNMGWMGFWMVFGWIIGLAVLILLVWIVARAAGGQPGRAEETPEQILKRRYARGEMDREDYERRLSDLRK
jgi:putative membrane protein